MGTITPELRHMIEAAVADGRGMDDIEHDLIEPADLPPDDHDALWLFAYGRSDYPHHRDVRIVAGS